MLLDAADFQRCFDTHQIAATKRGGLEDTRREPDRLVDERVYGDFVCSWPKHSAADASDVIVVVRNWVETGSPVYRIALPTGATPQNTGFAASGTIAVFSSFGSLLYAALAVGQAATLTPTALSSGSMFISSAALAVHPTEPMIAVVADSSDILVIPNITSRIPIRRVLRTCTTGGAAPLDAVQQLVFSGGGHLLLRTMTQLFIANVFDGDWQQSLAPLCQLPAGTPEAAPEITSFDASVNAADSNHRLDVVVAVRNALAPPDTRQSCAVLALSIVRPGESAWVVAQANLWPLPDVCDFVKLQRAAADGSGATILLHTVDSRMFAARCALPTAPSASASGIVAAPPMSRLL